MFIDTLRMVNARPIELLAIDEIVCGYIHFLEVLRAEGSTHIIKTLLAFQERYHHLLLDLGSQPESDAEDQPMLSFQATGYELVLFSAAVLGYLNFWREDMDLCQQGLIKHIVSFQKRCIDSQLFPCLPVVCSCETCARMRMRDAW